MTHTDSIREKIGQDEGVSVKICIYIQTHPFVCVCHFSDGTPKILFSMSMHVLTFKNTVITLQNMKKLFINRCVFWRTVFFLCKVVNADKLYAL